MKPALLNPADKASVQALLGCLMDMNARDDRNADQRSTYGHIHDAVCDFVLNQTDISIRDVDWNLGGNATWSDDIQRAIFNVLNSQ